ncbi:MAG: DNA cytosine methyltransferase [Pirellulaceae bacterium]|nr:DNA cytosine methyltransferase [Pirellulaceae bacterium]
MTRRKEVRAFDLFCGGGGSSIGARQAGAVPVGGADLWPLAAEAYCQNLPGARAYRDDISGLDPKAVGREVGPIDLLLASPECTHHSVAKGNKPRSEKSKQLAFQVVRFAEVMKPRWIVVENVIQMRSWAAYGDWLGQIQGLGYKTITPTLDAQHFGVPQTRRRLFVVCDQERVPEPPRFYRKKNATVSAILRRAKQGNWSYDYSPLDNGKRAQKTIERAERAIQSVGQDQEFVMVYYGSDGAGGFQTLDRPLRTVTTLDRFAIVRPNCVGHEMRMLQPPELALAMGFPPNYRFPASATRRDCIKLIGNAVCPPVMRAIVKSLMLDRPARSTC